MGKFDRAPGLSRLFSAAFLLLCMACFRPALHSNFDVGSWQGTVLGSGQKVRFADVRSHKLVLNVYSPTCQPCIEEIPALNLAAGKLASQKIPFYMVVDARPELHGLPKDAPRSVLEARLEQDRVRYKIALPIVLMDGPLVSPRTGVVTGNPETMIFDMDPLRLRYNFIGPISTAKSNATLEADPRLAFFLKQI